MTSSIIQPYLGYGSLGVCAGPVGNRVNANMKQAEFFAVSIPHVGIELC